MRRAPRKKGDLRHSPADVRDFIDTVRKARTTYFNLAAGVEHIDDDGRLLPYPRHLHPQ